jgi:hypothetical protein
MLSGVESCASSEDGGASTSSAGSYSTLQTGGSPAASDHGKAINRRNVGWGKSPLSVFSSFDGLGVFDW